MCYPIGGGRQTLFAAGGSKDWARNMFLTDTWGRARGQSNWSIGAKGRDTESVEGMSAFWILTVWKVSPLAHPWAFPWWRTVRDLWKHPASSVLQFLPAAKHVPGGDVECHRGNGITGWMRHTDQCCPFGPIHAVFFISNTVEIRLVL